MKKLTLFAAVTAFLLSFTTLEPASWSLDKAHARLGFTVTHLAISEVEGAFKNFDATITALKEDFSDAIVTLTADVNSISTDNEQRDTHLKSPDFFDAAKYPTLIFKSTSFTKAGDKKYKVTGNLTMHGITKTIELDAAYNTGIHPVTKKTITGFKVTGTIKRSDFGIGTSFLAAMISDEVTITANAEFIKNENAE